MDELYTIEYEVTKSCDLNCSYCFERGHFCNVNSSDEMDVKFVEFVRRALVEISSNITVTFWGGEPSMNMKSVSYVCRELAGEVKFSVYHNGFSSKLTNFVISETAPEDWDFIQVSYDGRAVQDTHRLTHKGEPTADLVMGNFDTLYSNGYPVSLKATLPVSDIGKMYDVWCEFDELSNKYKNISYFPSLDGEYSKEVYDTFKDQVAKITHAEYVRSETRDSLLCSWYLRDNNPKCGHGLSYITVSVTGVVLPCHGVLYYDIPEFNIANITDDDVFDKIAEFKVLMGAYMSRRDSKCTGCESLVCNVCNIYAYSRSEKADMIDKLVDRCSNKWCSLYKLFGAYGRTLIKEIGKRNG